MLPTYEAVVRDSRSVGYLEDVYSTRRVPLTMIQLDQPPGSYPDAPAREITVQINNGAPCLCEFGIGGHRFEATMQPGDFVVTPPGERSEFDLHEPTRPLIAAIPSADLAARMGSPGRPDLADLGALHEGMHRDRSPRSLPMPASPRSRTCAGCSNRPPAPRRRLSGNTFKASAAARQRMATSFHRGAHRCKSFNVAKGVWIRSVRPC